MWNKQVSNSSSFTSRDSCSLFFSASLRYCYFHIVASWVTRVSIVFYSTLPAFFVIKLCELSVSWVSQNIYPLSIFRFPWQLLPSIRSSPFSTKLTAISAPSPYLFLSPRNVVISMIFLWFLSISPPNYEYESSSYFKVQTSLVLLVIRSFSHFNPRISLLSSQPFVLSNGSLSVPFSLSLFWNIFEMFSVMLPWYLRLWSQKFSSQF